MRGEDTAGYNLPVPSDAEWTMPASWGAQYRAEDRRGYRANPAGHYEARPVLRRIEGGKAVRSTTGKTVPKQSLAELKSCGELRRIELNWAHAHCLIFEVSAQEWLPLSCQKVPSSNRTRFMNTVRSPFPFTQRCASSVAEPAIRRGLLLACCSERQCWSLCQALHQVRINDRCRDSPHGLLATIAYPNIEIVWEAPTAIGIFHGSLKPALC